MSLSDDMQMASGVSPGLDIDCRDCRFRDKSCIAVLDRVIPVGVTKDNCEIFVYPMSKPHEVLFDEEPCEFKEVDDEFFE